jgi:hypothetical protein
MVAAALALLAIAAPGASGAPTFPLTAFSSVTTTSVTLEAEINPEGKATKYHFEYGSQGPCASTPCLSTPEAKAIGGSVPVPVEARIEGLNPGTTYHFRAVAGPSAGPDTSLSTYGLSPDFAPCPANEAFRAGQFSPVAHPSAALPDCRAYEQASPVQKNGVDSLGIVAYTKASVNGDAIGFGSTSGFPGAEGSQELPLYLATRDPNGWSIQGMLPPQAYGESAYVKGWTPDFSEIFTEGIRLGPPADSSFLEQSSADRSITEIVPKGEGMSHDLDTAPEFVGASAGGDEVVFESRAKLTPAALAGKSNVYAWDQASGKLGLAGTFNAETSEGTSPPEGTFAGSYDWIEGTSPTFLRRGGAAASYYTQDEHAVAADGSVIFTTAVDGQLYSRENPTQEQSKLDGRGSCTEATKACTLHISASQRTNGAGAPNGTGKADAAGSRPAAFQAASTDGSNALFTSTEKLTNDATTGPEPPPPAIGRSDLEGHSIDTGFCPVISKGVAVDGSHIYWTNPVADTISRAGLQCQSPEVIVSGADNPQYVAVSAGHLYWTNAGDGNMGTGTIGKAKLSVAGADEIDETFIKGSTNPQGIALDSEHVYWCNAGGRNTADGEGNGEDSGAVGRANLDGEDIQQAFIQLGSNDQHSEPQGIAVNSTNIYLTRVGGYFRQFNYLDRYSIDGNPASWKFFFIHEEGHDVAGVGGIALDGSHAYWGMQAGNTIGRINLALEGESAEPEIVAQAGNPLGLGVDTEHLYWSLNGEVQPNPGNDLYRYDTASGELRDLTVDHSDPDGAEVRGVLGTSQDASAVYFVANGVPDGVANSPNGHEENAEAGNCRGGPNGNFTGECNLYLARDGRRTVFIARLDSSGNGTDAQNWLPQGLTGGRYARVSSDGSVLLFRSQRQLTSYSSQGVTELYRYQEGARAVACVTCNPTGEAPIGPNYFYFGNISLSALIPSEFTYVLSRNLSSDGNRVFFQTTEALVGTDTNGTDGCSEEGTTQHTFPSCQDVYEWEAQGTGSCTEDVEGGGCLYLLSTGKSRQASFLADASASGNDIFLMTSDPGLVRQDADQLYDVYDIRSGGGLTSQNQIPAPICEAEGCRAGFSPLPGPPPCGSACFAGPVNPKPTRHQKKHHRRSKKHGKHRHKHPRTARRSSR